jgi:dTMP kinase
VQEWREYYENDGLILTDRYTTSNALHQGAKVAAEERELFFKWLYDYEFNLIGLPSPDIVMYMDIDAEFAAGRLRQREAETNTNADIHESNMVYLCKCAESGRHAASLYGWHSIKCMNNGSERDIDDIHVEVYNKLQGLLM